MLIFKTQKNKTTLLKSLPLALLIFIGNLNVGFGQTATYTVTSTTAVSTSGTAPSGSSASYGQTYATAKQLTSGNSATLTLSGYTGMRITQIVLEMKSNNSSGSGNLSVMAGSTSIAAVATSAFNNASWNGSWSSTYVDITKTPTAYTVGASENVVIKIAATANSLYIQKYTITYELVPTCTFPTTQATTAAFSTITNNSMDLSWASGNGNGRIVVMKEASAVSGTPTSGTAYTANAAFGSGSTIATNEFVVYNGTGNSVSVSGLKCGTTYYAKVYEYNTTDVCYNTTSPASASASTLTPTITATPTSLTGFTYLLGSGPSGNQNYSLTASNLSPASGNITVTPSGTNYEVSTDGTTFSTTVNVPYVSGTLAATTIYARLKAGLAVNASYTSSITNTYANNTSCAASATVSLSGSVTAPTPSIVLNSSNPAIPLGNISTSTTNNLVYGFSLDVSVYQAVLSGVTITTAGTYTATNLTNLKCWYSADALFDAGDQLLSTKTASLGIGAHLFPSFTNKTIASGTTGYIFITSDVPCATIGNTITVSAITTANLTFTSGNKSGTAFVGGTKTFVDGAVNNVTALTTTNCVSGGTTVNWTLPAGCYDEILVVATSGSYTSSIPSGDGTAYTANTTFGSGTAFDGGTVVFKGSGNSASVTGLTNNTNYTYKVFTRKGTIWSSGVSVNCTPVIAYCVPTYTIGCSSNDRITNFILESISNNSGSTCSTNPNGYSDYTSLSTNLTEGISYNSSIDIGSGGSAGVSIWIDFNNNGTFDASENVGYSSGTFTSGSTGNVISLSIPLGSISGTHRMRVRHVYNTAGINIDPCSSYSYGEVEDYTVNIIPACTPTATITSFLPTSGPIATLVTITGTGFTGATAVQFGGINTTTFTVVNSTTILAEVPAGIGASSQISVSDASTCATISSGNYTLTYFNGSCSAYPNFIDLFMSEVYDEKPGDGWYMELYNPTNSPITLTGVYQIERYGELNLTGSYNLIDLTGTVAPMSTFVIQLHSNVSCPSLSVDFQAPGNWGINANDRIRLIKNGTVVDDVSTPAYIGYTILRDMNPSVVAPNTAYPSVGWTTLPNQDCSDLGVFNLPPSSSIVINTQPADITGCSLTMSVISPTPGITYQWKFNNPANMAGWMDVNSTSIPVAIIAGETSSTLTITGDVSALMDFQFYCEVSESGCSILSNAAQFKIDARPIYRSVAASNGNWSTVSNWEMSTDYTNYVAACSYPRSINSSEVIIQTGTRIVLDLTGANAVDIDHLTIENTGTLELLPNAKLTIYDSIAGADLIVNGTLYDRNSAGNAMDLTNSTWILGANGTVIKSNNGAIAFYRDKYQGGMSNIPATANWIYRYTGDGHPVVGTEDFFYPNLSFENTTASTYSWNNPVNTAFQGSTGFATVKGNFDIGVIGTSTCEVSNVNTHAQPMLLLGNLNIATGSSLLNSAASGTDYGTGYELKGNLFVDGTLNILNGALERVMRFTGTTNQTVSGVGTIDLHKMTVNKPSGDVLLNRNLQAQNELVMIQGNIFTNASMLELGLSTTQKGILTHTNGFVVGKMRRWFNGTNSGNATGLYPMGFEDLVVGAGTGVKNRHSKIEFTSAPTGGHLTVQYIGTPMGPDGIPILAVNSGGAGFDVITTEDQGYWKFDNESGKLINAAYTISCTGEGYQVITDLNKLTLLKRVVANGPNWFCPGAHIATSGTIAMPTVSRSGVSNWSNFGFGGGTGNPLPVELTAFQVSCDEDQIQIHWSTASELNSSHFEVEKSNDLINWNLISETAAAGNSNINMDYQTSDIERSSDVIYYRLKQVDLNGESKVYGPISTLCEIESNSMKVYPNPTQGEYQVEINWTETSTNAQLQLLDLTGKVIHEMDLNLNTGTTHLQFNQENLQMGTYLIRLQDNKSELNPIRLVITK